MADDGLLVNFSLGDGVLTSKSTFKGGPWRARRQANKIATRHAQIPQASSKNTQEEIKRQLESADVRPAKRQRTSDERDEQPSTTTQNGHPTRPPSQRDNGRKPQVQRQVISSLFTYNPQSVTSAGSKPAVEELPQEPSNAPLKNELDTFTSLGLSTTLASHLLKKMELKAPTAIQKAAIPQLLGSDSDAFIQAETGSGKTLAYLLPIVQKIMALSGAANEDEVEKQEKNNIQRHSGLFAIVLAPTRELSKQIAVVLESLLRCAHWIVPGTVIGGEKKKAEKARLRKGLNILVATPGRLADHIEHTEALDVSNVRWLILDEGDRLMELGFEREIQKIVSVLNLRMKAQKAKSIPGLPAKRTTILCSATMKLDVERLGQISLKDPIDIHAASDEKTEAEEGQPKEQKFSAPMQLQRSYAVVPAKLRLVTLIAVLKRAFAHKGSVMKAIVFLSCADSVDFHFDVLVRDSDEDSDDEAGSSSDSDDLMTNGVIKTATPVTSSATTITHAPSSTLSNPTHTTTIYRLHGSLTQSLRTSTLNAYTRNSDPSLLICTDVASRGLDVPNVDLVIEFDPAFSHDDHLHRIGRTARAGRPGRTLVFLMPGPEEGYVQLIRQDGGVEGRPPARHDAADLLNRAFSTTAITSTSTSKSSSTNVNTKHGKNSLSSQQTDWERRATALQLNIERWTLASPRRLDAARRAFQSHVRAYATHVVAERSCFDVKELHLGHLAKAFGLRERPGGFGRGGGRDGGRNGGRTGTRMRTKRVNEDGESRGGGGGGDGNEGGKTDDVKDAARKMRAKVKMAKGGGVEEFNLG